MPPEVRQFCTNNAPTAGAARIAWQAAKLDELDTQLKQRIAELDAKRAEYEDWLNKREEMLKKAQEDVVAIYSKMAPEAAAKQLAQWTMTWRRPCSANSIPARERDSRRNGPRQGGASRQCDGWPGDRGDGKKS